MTLWYSGEIQDSKKCFFPACPVTRLLCSVGENDNFPVQKGKGRDTLIDVKGKLWVAEERHNLSPFSQVMNGFATLMTSQGSDTVTSIFKYNSSNTTASLRMLKMA